MPNGSGGIVGKGVIEMGSGPECAVWEVAVDSPKLLLEPGGS